MKNARVKVLIITNCCGLSSLVKPDTVGHVLCSCVQMYSCLIKQSKSVESAIDVLGAASLTAGGSPGREKKCENVKLAS
jgi:hypothetical protein